jgi:hypothetical protein
MSSKSSQPGCLCRLQPSGPGLPIALPKHPDKFTGGSGTGSDLRTTTAEFFQIRLSFWRLLQQ